MAWSTVGAAARVLLLLGHTVHAHRADSDVDYLLAQSQIPEQGRGQQEPWLPQQVVQQSGRRPLPTSRHPPWLPQQVVVRKRRTHLTREPWLPQQVQQVQQQTHTRLPDDPWIPEVQQQQTQIKVTTWPEQQPQRDSCRFNYSDVPKNHIHSFLVRSDQSVFLYPDLEGRSRVVEMAPGTTVLASCPGDNNGLLLNGRSYVYATCRKARLVIGRQPVTLADLGCRKKPKPDLKRGRRCGRSRRTRIIGWNIRRGVFVPQITLCFNERQETTVFASHLIHGRNIDAKVIDPSRPSFRTAKMFFEGVQRSYSKVSQKSLLRDLLNTTEHLTAKRQHYLAKGHLAPDSDFVLEAEQDATYYYANVVPQWQAVNNGNWRRLENAVRELAIRRNATLKVWTGTHGVLELPDYHRNPTRVFLGLTHGKELVPVPALLWKVIYDSSTNAAVAIVEVNDVRGLGTSASWSLLDPMCPDVCHQLPWVTWDTSNLGRGRTFCCSVDALRKTIADIPSLGYVSLLRY